MSYLMMQARNEKGSRTDFFIKNGKIAYAAKRLERLKHMRMDCGGFTITPARVAVDFSLMHLQNFSSYKKRMIHHQRNGCTTVLAVCPINAKKPFKPQLKKARHHMINSSVDYIIGISYPLRELTPAMIRACKRAKISVIFANVEAESDFDRVEWAWIRDALFPYRTVVVPGLHKFSGNNKQWMKMLKIWEEISTENNIPTLFSFPEDRGILTKPIIRKIGISPLKGELRVGSEIDYNLYQTGSLAGDEHVLYDKKYIPDIVVLKGKVMKAGDTVHYRPGFGREIIIRVPGYFASYD